LSTWCCPVRFGPTRHPPARPTKPGHRDPGDPLRGGGDLRLRGVDAYRAVPYAPSRYNTMRVNLAGLAISHVVPGGTAPAGALSYRIFNELGVPRRPTPSGSPPRGRIRGGVEPDLLVRARDLDPLNGFNPAYGFAALAGVFLLLRSSGRSCYSRAPATRDRWLRAAARHLPVLHPDKISELLGKVAGRITLLINNRRTLWWAFAWAGSTGCSTPRVCGFSCGPLAP